MLVIIDIIPYIAYFLIFIFFMFFFLTWAGAPGVWFKSRDFAGGSWSRIGQVAGETVTVSVSA